MRTLRPAAADVSDQPGYLLHRPGGRITVGGPQLGGQQMPAAEDIERQIAVAVVIAMEEASFLLAMQRVVGGIEVQHDLLGRAGVGLQEQIDKQPLDRDGSWLTL